MNNRFFSKFGGDQVQSGSDDMARDIEIQTKLDTLEPIAAESDRDVRAYQRLYTALGRSDSMLTAAFAHNVMVKILRSRLAARDSATTLFSVLLSSAALGASLCVVVLAPGLGNEASTSMFSLLLEPLIESVPISATYLAGCLIAVALLDILINQQQTPTS